MIRFQVLGLEKVTTALDGVTKALLRELVVGMRKVGLHVEGRVKDRKLSGQVLKVRTGNLRRNIVSEVRVESADVIAAVIGVTDAVPYGRIHELGGQSGRGHLTFLPPRPFLRPAVWESLPEIRRILGDHVAIALREF